MMKKKIPHYVGFWSLLNTIINDLKNFVDIASAISVPHPLEIPYQDICRTLYVVSFDFRRKLVLHISHLKCFFLSWTTAMCIFKPPFREKFALQLSHLWDFFRLCTEAICVVKLLFWGKHILHILHLIILNQNILSIRMKFISWTV